MHTEGPREKGGHNDGSADTGSPEPREKRLLLGPPNLGHLFLQTERAPSDALVDALPETCPLPAAVVLGCCGVSIPGHLVSSPCSWRPGPGVVPPSAGRAPLFPCHLPVHDT